MPQQTIAYVSQNCQMHEGHFTYNPNLFSDCLTYHGLDRLVGLVVKASAWRAEDPGFESHLRKDFFRVESYQ